MLSLLALPVAFAQQSDAESAISSAKQKIVACYLAAKDAEAAGADRDLRQRGAGRSAKGQPQTPPPEKHAW